MNNNYTRQKGFTLIEMMVVLAIVAILATFAIPNFSQFMERSRFRSTIASIQSTISLARSQAIRTQTSMEIKPAAGGWNDGWAIYESGQTNPFRSFTKPYESIHLSGNGSISINPSGIMSPGAIGNVTADSQEVQLKIVANRLCNSGIQESSFLKTCPI